MRRPATAVALFAILMAAPGLRAQDLSATDRAEAREHFDRGRSAYEAGQYEDAVKELKQAYMISRKAAILFNLGQTYLKLGDPSLALHFFQKFLAESDPADPNRPVASKAIEEAQAANVPPPGSPATPAAEDAVAPTPSSAETAAGNAEEAAAGGAPDFRHAPVGDAPPGHPIDIRVRLGEGAELFPATLFYRTLGHAQYTKVTFTKASSGLIARIPRKVLAIGVKAVQYYVEARSPDGKIHGSSGSAAKPHVIAIDPAAQIRVLAEAEAFAAPTAEALKSSLPLARFYRPAKFAAAGVAALMLGAAAAYAAYGVRLTAEMETRSRSSSGQLMDGSWSNPTIPYGPGQRELEADGKRANTIATTTAILGVVMGGAAGGLFYLDHRRHRDEQPLEVAFAPLVGPGFGGAGGGIRF